MFVGAIRRLANAGPHPLCNGQQVYDFLHLDPPTHQQLSEDVEVPQRSTFTQQSGTLGDLDRLRPVGKASPSSSTQT